MEGEPAYSFVSGYFLKVENNTNRPIYIDLTNCFAINNEGLSVPFFSNASYSTSNDNTKGSSVNLAAVANAVGVGGVVGTLANGISIGSGKSNGSNITVQERPVIVVPPHASMQLPSIKGVKDNQIVDMPWPLFYCPKPVKSFDGQEKYFPTSHLKADNNGLTASQINLTEFGFVNFTPQESPKTLRFLVTYSLDSNFSQYYQLPIELYLKSLYGKEYWHFMNGRIQYDYDNSDNSLLIGISNLFKK